MFTGIISEIGTVREVARNGGGIRLSIDGKQSIEGAKPGDSISVSGVCQTIVLISDGTFTVEAVEETISKTTLGKLAPGSRVNLESPLRLGDQLGGHLVQGHVDGVGSVRSVTPRADSWMIEIEIPEELARYVVPVGSIAVDGISLTVASRTGRRAIVSIIPHTMQSTTLSDVRAGSPVNLECDLIGKYVESLLLGGTKGKEGTITTELLRRWGYEP